MDPPGEGQDHDDREQKGQQQQKQNVASLLDKLALAPAAQPKRKDVKEKYAFWETQPVMQFAEISNVSILCSTVSGCTNVAAD